MSSTSGGTHGATKRRLYAADRPWLPRVENRVGSPWWNRQRGSSQPTRRALRRITTPAHASSVWARTMRQCDSRRQIAVSSGASVG